MDWGRGVDVGCLCIWGFLSAETWGAGRERVFKELGVSYMFRLSFLSVNAL